jgi:glycosyltransferase involved in cell wall biosynthesis
VVIATYRRPDLLRRCLAAVLAQDIEREDYEVLVVDDGHSDETRIAVEALTPAEGAPALRYLRPGKGRGPAVARNCGWRAAYGTLIAFTDDDTIPDRHWLARGERALGPEQVAVTGRVRVPPVESDGQRPTDHELMTRGLESAEFATANAFVRRTALQRVQGFDEQFRRAWREDSDLQFRLMRDAGPVGHCDDAVVLHPVRPEPWGVSLRQQRNVFFDALLYRKHPRLYRERIRAAPPWNYYFIVVLTLAAILLAILHVPGSAVTSALLAVGLVVQLTLRRLHGTARTGSHILEMLVTSALIPFLSVYWRIRGALHFRVWFL